MKCQSNPSSSRFYRNSLIAVGTVFSIFFMAMALRRMEWETILRFLTSMRPYPWLFFAVLIYILGHLIRGVRTRLLVSCDAKISVITAINIVVVGYGVNNVLPGRLGELARAGMLSERTGIPFTQSIAVVFLERLLDGIVILMLLSLSILLLNVPMPLAQTVGVAALIFGLSSVFVIFMILAPNLLVNSASKTMYAINPKWHDRALKIVSSIINCTKYLHSPLNALTIFIVSGAVWLCDVGLFLLIMPIFGLGLSVPYAIFLMAVTNLGLFIPSGPGHIIAFRVFCLQGLTLLGISQTTALDYSMVVNLAIYVPMILWGGGVILWYAIVLGLTFSLTKKAKSIDILPEATAVPAKIIGRTSTDLESETASTFILTLIEASLPLDRYVLSEPREVIAATASFVHGEIKNLPRRFRILFMAGLNVFALLIWLRYFRAFQKLPLEKRIKIFNSWAYGNLAPTRQLFRLIRSTALLAFYEHPSVVQALSS